MKTSKVMRNCCVLTCTNGYESGEPVSFHRFPFRNKPLLSKWIEAVNRDSNWKPSKWSCICSAHFKESDFIPHQRAPRLRDDAYPSVFTSSLQSQVKKKLAPDGRYDMQSTDTTFIKSEKTEEPMETQYVEFSPSSQQIGSTVFLQSCDGDFVSNQIFIKDELEDIDDIFYTESANTSDIEIHDTNVISDVLELSSSADDTIDENEIYMISPPAIAEIDLTEVFICDYCNKIFDDKSILQKHILTHTKGYFCILCDEIFEFQFDLIKHEQEHLSVGKKYFCRICHKSFTSSWNLNLHERVHTFNQDRVYICRKCRVTLPCKKNLIKHMAMHLCEDCFVCNNCGKTFPKKRTLITHISVHTNQKHYVCDVCKKTFNYRSSLLIHKLIHTDLKYSCKHCMRMFPLKSNLIVHELQHTNKPPFPCPYCKFRCSKKKTLILHIRKHLHEKPYACFYCYEQFHDQNNLRKHETTHAGIEPIFPEEETLYPCLECGKIFSQNRSLAHHSRIHLKKKQIEWKDKNEKTNSCQHCGKHFGDEPALKSHMLLHVQKTPDPSNSFVTNLKSRFKSLLTSYVEKQTTDDDDKSTKDTSAKTHNSLPHIEFKLEPGGETCTSVNNNVITPSVKDEPIYVKNEPEYLAMD